MKDRYVKKSEENISNEEQLIWLMDTYGDQIIKLAYTYVKSEHAAEDLSQEIFLKCYEKLDSFRGESSIKTWLYRIAINKCKDYLKTWSYKRLYFTGKIESFYKNVNPGADAEYFDKNSKLVLSEHVLSMPLKYREVIILYYYENLTIKEISELLYINSNTVKSRLVRGRNGLKQKLKGMNFNEG